MFHRIPWWLPEFSMFREIPQYSRLPRFLAAQSDICLSLFKNPTVGHQREQSISVSPVNKGMTNRQLTHTYTLLRPVAGKPLHSYTVSQKKTCDYIFYNNFNNKCPITIIFGIVNSKSMCHRTLIVKVIVENVVTFVFWDMVYILICVSELRHMTLMCSSRQHAHIKLFLPTGLVFTTQKENVFFHQPNTCQLWPGAV